MRCSLSLVSPRIDRKHLRICLGFAVATVAFYPQAEAQHDRRIPVEGYITAVRAPDSFDVNDLHVAISPRTGFGIIGTNAVRNDNPLREALQVGAFVEVKGKFDRHTKTTAATAIYLRDDWDRKLSGVGVIDKVVSHGSDPVFRADGYLIRITAATNLTFADELNSLADVETNTWLRFEGKRDNSGVVVASQATFLPAKSTQFRRLLGATEDPTKGLLPGSLRHAKPAPENPNEKASPPEINPHTGNRVDFEKTLDRDGNLTEDAGIRWGALGGWRTIPADRALQQRVRGIGMRLVPAYQNDLADDHPSKIHFRFYVVDDDRFRSEICPLSGLILVPKQVLERLKDDDQLAAVLADGVAYNLQRQAARVSADNRALVGVYVATAFAPALIFLPALDATISTATRITTTMYEERARIALTLLSDAGYDPHQAPEAWRLLYPKHLPKDPDTLPYPGFSGYQLSILTLQYRRAPKTGAVSALR